ncbi:MAG: FkbM family methyltransferase [Steroidobacteraceae bacterium]
MKTLTRKLSTILSAPFHSRNYVAAANMLRIYEKPWDAYARYLLGSGSYPAVIRTRTPTGALPLTVWSAHDVLTVNEIFCRHDYPARREDSVFVDFGSNIGISGAYFLSRGPNSFAYLFEPLPQNIDRLRHNLRGFEERYSLEVAAVGLQRGEVQFGYEETGRYGGIGRNTGRYVSVPCLDSNEVLTTILARHGHIDVLKIDIETLERQVTERIPLEMRRQIARIYVEHPFTGNPLSETHTYRQYSLVAQFFLQAQA